MSVTARDEQIEELIEYWARMGIVELGEQYPDEFMTDADVVFRAATETFRYLERVGLLRDPNDDTAACICVPNLTCPVHNPVGGEA